VTKAMKSLTVKQIARTFGLVGLTAAFAWALAGCTGPGQASRGAAQKEQQASQEKGASGIEVVRIGRAVNGMMLDLRYRITDFARAREALKQNTPLSIIEQSSGRVLSVSEGSLGKLRNLPQNDNPGNVYWTFFVNPGGAVQAGAAVTLKIGELQIKDLTVQ
jgi:hypothetical protein